MLFRVKTMTDIDMLPCPYSGYTPGASGMDITDDNVELTMENLVKSMEEHLSNVTDKSHLESTTTRVGGPRGKQHAFRPTASDAKSGNTFMDHQPTNNHEVIEKDVPWLAGIPSDPEDEEIDLDGSYPRLDAPFYHNLKQKYPRAFKRRNLNSSMSETSSICSDFSMLQKGRSRSACTTPRLLPQDGAGVHQPSRSGAHGHDEFDMNEVNMGIIGVPRPPRSRRGSQSRAGSQYSSNVSLCSDMTTVSTRAVRAHRNEAMNALRQRLMKNQQSWDQLLSHDPVRRHKDRTVRDGSVGRVPRGDEGPVCSTPRAGAEHATHERLRELERSLDKMAAEFGNEDVSPNLPDYFHVHLPDHQAGSNSNLTAKPPKPLVNNYHGVHGNKKKVLPMTPRFASPESHDSAVDMDSASLQSNISSLNNPRQISSQVTNTSVHEGSRHNDNIMTHRGQKSDQSRLADDPIPPPAQFAASRPSRARSRTPKLKSRGSSPFLQKDDSVTMVTPGTTTNSVPSRQDSDSDSGISQPVSNGVVVETENYRNTHKIRHQDRAGYSIRENHHISAETSPTHHGIHSSLPPPSPRTIQHGDLSAGTELSQPDRSRLTDRKRDHVTFEDDRRRPRQIGENKSRHQSQPALNGSLNDSSVSCTDSAHENGASTRSEREQHSNKSLPTSRDHVVSRPPSKTSTGHHSGASRAGMMQRSLSDDPLPPPRRPNKTIQKPVLPENDMETYQDANKALSAPPRAKHQRKKEQTAQGRDDLDDSRQRVEPMNFRMVRSNSEVSLNSEASFNSQLEDADVDGQKVKKKFKLPWKKNKGKFKPGKEMGKLMQKQMMGDLSRSSSRTSLTGDLPSGEYKGAEVLTPGDYSTIDGAPSRERLVHAPDEPRESGKTPQGRRSSDHKPPPAPKPKHLQQPNVGKPQEKPRESEQEEKRPSKMMQSQQQQELEQPRKQTMTSLNTSRDSTSAHSDSVPPKHTHARPPLPKKPEIAEKPQVNRSYENVPGADQIVFRAAEEEEILPESDVIEPDYATAAELNLNTSKASRKKSPSRSSRTHYEDVGGGTPRSRAGDDNPYESFDIRDGERIADVSHSGSDDWHEDEWDDEEEEDVPDPEDPAYLYSEVNYDMKSHHDQEVQYINYDEDFHEDRDSPPLPERGYRSNLANSKELGGSKNSLFNRMDSLKRSAKKKFSKLKKTLSVERVDKSSSEEGGASKKKNADSVPPSPTSPEHAGPFKRSPSLKSLTETFGFVKKIRERRNSGSGNKNQDSLGPGQRKPPRAPSGFKRNTQSISSPEAVDTPTHFRPIGNIQAVNKDGSQVVELNKPPHGPFGFYIARGNANCNHGIVVSRLSEGLPEHFFASLISVGDVILEINGQSVSEMSLDDVYEIMGSEDRLVVTLLPFALREES